MSRHPIGKILFWVLLLVPCITSEATAGPPNQVNYQGALTTTGGTPISGQKKLEFRIYDAITAGDVVWGPQTLDPVSVVDGNFSVILTEADGSGPSITTACGGGDRFLEIRIGEPGATLSDANAISPRQQLLSAPYALNGVPIGAILPYYGATAPDGWLLCDGAAIPIGDKRFDALRTFLGMDTTPDLRGEFLRGWSNGRPGVDAGRTLGSTQGQSTAVPNAGWSVSSDTHDHRVYWNQWLGDIPSAPHEGPGGSGSVGARTTTSTHGHSISGGDTETRPRNMAVNFIIKY